MPASVIPVCIRLATGSLLLLAWANLQAQAVDSQAGQGRNNSAVSATESTAARTPAIPDSAIPVNPGLIAGNNPLAQPLPEVMTASPVIDPNAAGICPAVTGFLQDYCAQYPDDASCKF